MVDYMVGPLEKLTGELDYSLDDLKNGYCLSIRTINFAPEDLQNDYCLSIRTINSATKIIAYVYVQSISR